ncbi:hypothetical protein TI06_23440, partial [Vibrio vulnificus]
RSASQLCFPGPGRPASAAARWRRTRSPLQHPAVLEGRGQAAIGLFVDTGDVAVELQVQALLAQFVAQMLADAAVEAAQE